MTTGAAQSRAPTAATAAAAAEPAPRPALLVLAVGNRSRGDDALGPALLERLAAAGPEALGPEVELLEDFQLQIEHALDLRGRRAVLFVDAARPGQAARPGPWLEPLRPARTPTPWTHALPPQAVLDTALRLDGHAPPAALLAIPGQAFELGAGLSAAAQQSLDAAEAMARAWLAQA